MIHALFSGIRPQERPGLWRRMRTIAASDVAGTPWVQTYGIAASRVCGSGSPLRGAGRHARLWL